MENVFPHCTGLDLDKKSVEAHVRRMEPEGRLRQETRRWGTVTREILAMADWLAARGVTHVAMESTGVLLEADLQHSGEWLHRPAGECPAI